MLGRLLLLVALESGLALSSAKAQQNFKATTIGSIPLQVNLGTLDFLGCLYSGSNSLLIGQTVPLPCDANGNLSVDIINGVTVNPSTISTLIIASGVAMTGSVQQLPSVAFPNGNVFLENTGTTNIAIFPATGGVGGTCGSAPSVPWIMYPGGDKLAYSVTNISAICALGTAGTGGLAWTGN